jgi:hypothetical protein
MILIDYNGVAIGSGLHLKGELSEDLFRHTILNTLRMYRNKFKGQYGELVICGDGRKNWRREVFPNYKFKRGKSKSASDVDWNELYRIIYLVFDELGENFPYKTVLVEECEADDVIATLSQSTQEFGNNEPIMIVSADKDFVQLQKYDNVRQYSPMKKQFIIEKNPRKQLLELVLRGDASDGVPNVLSPDNSFSEGIRQTSLRQATLDKLFDDLHCMGEEVYANYCRNKKLIDFEEIPETLKSEILNRFNGQDNWKNRKKVFPFLIEKRCGMLIEEIGDFI